MRNIQRQTWRFNAHQYGTHCVPRQAISFRFLHNTSTNAHRSLSSSRPCTTQCRRMHKWPAQRRAVGTLFQPQHLQLPGLRSVRILEVLMLRTCHAHGQARHIQHIGTVQLHDSLITSKGRYLHVVFEFRDILGGQAQLTFNAAIRLLGCAHQAKSPVRLGASTILVEFEEAYDHFGCAYCMHIQHSIGNATAVKMTYATGSRRLFANLNCCNVGAGFIDHVIESAVLRPHSSR